MGRWEHCWLFLFIESLLQFLPVALTSSDVTRKSKVEGIVALEVLMAAH